jgi:hypothetical protein
MAGKPFSKNLYERDDNAKDQFVSWLKAKGWEAWVNPEKYGIDVLAVDLKGQDHKFEVEVKHNWTGPTFQYETLHYSDRKRKFLEDPKHTAFVTFNHERTHIMLAPGVILSESPTIVKNTIYTKDEKFIEIAVSDCEIIQIEEIE